MIKYLIAIIFLFAVASPAFASTTAWQGFTTGQGSNAGNVSTGIVGVVMVAPTASIDPSAGPFTSTQTVTLSAPGSTSIHYFLNTTDLSNALTCSTGATTNPVTVTGSALLRAIACYGSTAGPMASFNYVFTVPPATAPAASSGGNTSSGGGGYTPPTTPPTLAQADFNNDRVVNILDFNILITHWSMTSGATKADGDANGDHKVNILDFNILITHWTN